MTASVLARVVQILQERQIPFALIGAAAMAARGVSRSTFDTDLFSIGPSTLDDGMWQALSSLGLRRDCHGQCSPISMRSYPRSQSAAESFGANSGPPDC